MLTGSESTVVMTVHPQGNERLSTKENKVTLKLKDKFAKYS